MSERAGPEFLTSMVPHQLGFKEQVTSLGDSSSSSMTSHRLSATFDPEDGEEEDHGEDNNRDEVINIRNMIEELSKKANEEIEIKGTASKNLENGLEVNIKEVEIGVPIERQRDVFDEIEESSNNSEEEEDFKDKNAIVYSFTLGDNVPVIIQKVGEEIINPDSEEENDCARQLVESKLVIDIDGKVSEINTTGKNPLDAEEEQKIDSIFKGPTLISEEFKNEEVQNIEAKIEGVIYIARNNIEVKNEEVNNRAVKNEGVGNIEVNVEGRNEEVKNIEVKNEEVNNKDVNDIKVMNQKVKNIEVKNAEENNVEEHKDELKNEEVNGIEEHNKEVKNHDRVPEEAEGKTYSSNSEEENKEIRKENNEENAGKRNLRDILFGCFLCKKEQKD